MKNRLNKLKIQIKTSLLNKLREEKQINKQLQKKIVNLTLADEQEKKYIDALTIKDIEIRQLRMRLRKYEK